jgi:hypothetical protein
MNDAQATEILRLLNSISEAFQSTVTDRERAALDARHAGEPQTAAYASGSRDQAMLEFTIDALKTLADDMDAILEQRTESLYRRTLEVYYQTEELSRDPRHAHLIEQVEAMRRAHEKDYGYPPPPREK